MANNIPPVIFFLLAQNDLSFDWLENLRLFLLLHRLLLLFLLHLQINIFHLNHDLGCLRLFYSALGAQCLLDLFWLLHDLYHLLFA